MSFFLSIVALVAGGIIALYAVLRLVRLHRESLIHQLRILPEQVISFAEPGRYDLHLEGPWVRSFAGIKYSLRDRASGQEVESRPILFGTRRSNTSRTTRSVRWFRVERPGEHIFSISGFSPGTDASQYAVAFARPYAAKVVFLTVLIILGWGLFLCALLLMPAALTALRGGS